MDVWGMTVERGYSIFVTAHTLECRPEHFFMGQDTQGGGDVE